MVVKFMPEAIGVRMSVIGTARVFLMSKQCFPQTVYFFFEAVEACSKIRLLFGYVCFEL